MVYSQSHKRTLVKTLGYRIILLFSYGIITYLITGRVDVAIEVASITTIVNTVIYYMYERSWNNIKWGVKIKK